MSQRVHRIRSGGSQGSKAEQSKTRDHDRENSKQAGKAAGQVNGGEFFLKLHIHERILEGISRTIFRA